MSDWFCARRMGFIADCLVVYGHINSGHLMRKFSISKRLAHSDLVAFQKLHPKAMRYDAHLKCFVSVDVALGGNGMLIDGKLPAVPMAWFSE